MKLDAIVYHLLFFSFHPKTQRLTSKERIHAKKEAEIRDNETEERKKWKALLEGRKVPLILSSMAVALETLFFCPTPSLSFSVVGSVVKKKGEKFCGGRSSHGGGRQV